MRWRYEYEKFKVAINKSCSAATLGAIRAQSISISFDSLQKKVEKRKDGSWHEVEDAIDFEKEYENYNRTLVGRALFLAKLEEAARLRCSIDEASFADMGCDYWDAVSAFDRRIGSVIGY